MMTGTVGIASFFGNSSPRTCAEITDDEASNASSVFKTPIPAAPVPKANQKKDEQQKKSKSKTPAEETEALMLDSDHDQDEDNDEELLEDEYIVEKIANHIVDDVRVCL